MSENHQAMKVTSLSDIKARASSLQVLPGWDEDQPFVARLRRVSLLSLIQAGKLPNELLSMAHKVASSSGQSGYNPVTDSNPDELRHFTGLLHAIAEDSLVEPTYQEIMDAAGYLTDDQLSAIFVYCTSGVKALETFRHRLGPDAEAGGGGEDVRSDAEQLPAGADDV